MTRRSIADIKARADEFADAFENYVPKSSDRDAPLPPVMAVKLAAWRIVDQRPANHRTQVL